NRHVDSAGPETPLGGRAGRWDERRGDSQNRGIADEPGRAPQCHCNRARYDVCAADRPKSDRLAPGHRAVRRDGGPGSEQRTGDRGLSWAEKERKRGELMLEVAGMAVSYEGSRI